MICRIAMVVLVSMLASCATTSTSVTESGKTVYDIDCSGKLTDIKACYNKAEKLCPKGYKTLPYQKKEIFNPYPLNSHLGIATALAKAIPGFIKVKGITVQCKA